MNRAGVINRTDNINNVQIWMFTILFSLNVMFVGSFDVNLERPFAVFALMGIVGMLFGAIKKKGLNASNIATITYVLFWTLTSFYAISGKFALYGVNRIYIAMFIYLCVYYLANNTTLRRVIMILSAVGAVSTVISIDAASAGFLSKIFKAIMSVFTRQYTNNGIFEFGSRITSIFGNPNVFAGLIALTCIMSVYLFVTSKNNKEKMCASIVLGINALGFLLAFSVGATMSFALACLVYIILSKEKIYLITTMTLVALTTVLMTFLSFMGLGKTMGFLAFLPHIVILLQCMIIYALDRFVGVNLAKTLEKKSKVAGFALMGLIAFAGIYMMVGFNLTTEYIGINASFTRALYLQPGEYTLETDKSEGVILNIYSQDTEQTMMHETTNLYYGSDATINFTVPEGSKVTKFDFTGTGDVKTATLNGDIKIKLKYTLLPEFIANRLQGIKANQNAIQRLVFFKDGIEVFKESPVFGVGIGGFETALTGVQDFYYETKFVHNHYIQTLAEGGIFGLLVFVLMLGSMFFVLIKALKKKSDNPILPALFAAMVMMSIHSMVEVVFSVGVYLLFAFFIFGLISSLDETYISNKVIRIGAIIGFAIALTVNLGNFMAKVITSSRNNTTFTTLSTAQAIDIYEKNDYLLAYVLNSSDKLPQNIQDTANKYAKKLSKATSNSIPQALTGYYLETNQYDEAIAMMDKSIAISGSVASTWHKQFDNLEKYIDPVGKTDYEQVSKLENTQNYIPLIKERVAILDKYNENRLQKIKLSPKNNVFLTKIYKIDKLGLSSLSDILNVFSNTIFDSSILSDSISVASGDATINADGSIIANSDSVIEVQLATKIEGTYEFKMNTLSDISSVDMNGQIIPLERYVDNIYADISIPENLEGNALKILINLKAGAKINIITMNKVI